MKRVLITGGTGFVGANLTRYLIERGCEIHLIVRPQYNAWRLTSIESDIHLHVVDLMNGNELEQLLKKIRPEWIFHLAVYGAYSSQCDLQQMINTNITSTANLVRASLCVDFEAFVNTGSSSEYGLKTGPPKENAWIDPNSYYACTKAAATHLCRHLSIEHDLHITTLRLYSAYGPFEEPTRLIPTLVRYALRSDLPPLVSPNVARDFVYVEDVCRAYQLAAMNPQQQRGAIYNVGTGVQTTLEMVVKHVTSICNIKKEPQWGSMPERAWDTTSWVANCEKIHSELNWRPQVDFAQGFQHTLKWFAANLELIPNEVR